MTVQPFSENPSSGSSAAGANSGGSARQDCELLMNAALPRAEHFLQKSGEFYPFGAAMAPCGGIVDVAAYDGREHPPSADLIELLEKIFTSAAKAGEYKATALVYDVKVNMPWADKKSDAIAVALDHIGNYSVVVFFPYELVNGELRVGDPFSQKGADVIFSPGR